MIEREYYPLNLAAEKLGCTVDDLIHLGANGKAGICALADGWPSAAYGIQNEEYNEPVCLGQSQYWHGPVYLFVADLKRFEANPLTGIDKLPMIPVDEYSFCYFQIFDNDNPEKPRHIPISSLRLVLMRDDFTKLKDGMNSNAYQYFNEKPTSWPWGSHETELLRHLAAAARQWWSTYDPDDKATAPTNGAVEDWLKSNGVPDRVAEVMAQILRADDVRKGRRKGQIAAPFNTLKLSRN